MRRGCSLLRGHVRQGQVFIKCFLPCVPHVHCHPSQMLPCGRHRCTQRCHVGACEKCSMAVDRRCRCGAVLRSTVCGTEFLCDKRCNRMRNCGRHHCRRRCCDGKCPPCEEVRGRSRGKGGVEDGASDVIRIGFLSLQDLWAEAVVQEPHLRQPVPYWPLLQLQRDGAGGVPLWCDGDAGALRTRKGGTAASLPAALP